MDAAALARRLDRIDGRGYRAYKDLRGHYALDDVELHVDHVQGDPFAAPSKLRARVCRERADLPPDWCRPGVRRLALADFLARRASEEIARLGGRRRGSGRSGLLAVDAGGQVVLERTAVRISDDAVELRLVAGLPAAGRRVLAREARGLLLDDVPAVARRALCADALPAETLDRFVAVVENQEHLRGLLDAAGLLAFVGDGAILPRESGASDRPLRTGAVPFVSPPSLRVTLPLAHPLPGPDGSVAHEITGLGIPRGVTLVVGGGYHGKSTLLRALERAVYPHVPGDGRDRVVTAKDAVKIRAEDGRRVEQVDIHGFVRDLPGGRTTRAFSSDDASGSTSQAANIVEAIEAGARGLLLDEDTSATNFMVRDARMQALVAPADEPITPFLDRIRELHEAHGVSTVLVMGGCGDYFDVADTVIRMHDYRPSDATADARRIARTHPAPRPPGAATKLPPVTARVPLADSFDASRGRREVKIDARGLDLVLYGRERLELRGLEQLVDPSQTRAVGHAIHLASRRFMDGERTLAEVLDALEALLDAEGLDVLDPFHRPGEHPGDYARPRRYEIAGAIGRLRSVRMRPCSDAVPAPSSASAPRGDPGGDP